MSTVQVDDQLFREVENLAASSGATVQVVVEDAIRAALALSAQRARRAVRLPTYGGSGLQPGIDLDNSAALLDLMDAPE